MVQAIGRHAVSIEMKADLLQTLERAAQWRRELVERPATRMWLHPGRGGAMRNGILEVREQRPEGLFHGRWARGWKPGGRRLDPLLDRGAFGLALLAATGGS